MEKTVDAISQAICIVDAHGTVRRANRVFADLIQVAVTAIPGRPWLGLLPPPGRTPWRAPSRTVGEPGGDPRRGARAAADRHPMAEPGSAVLVFEDQTDRRRLQEQLIQSEKMSAIGQLIAGVAHDLNNPLASVVGFSDFLAEAGDVPPRSRNRSSDPARGRAGGDDVKTSCPLPAARRESAPGSRFGGFWTRLWPCCATS